MDQTYRDYEIIFLDDASTDHSVDLVREKFGSGVARFEINTKNTGNPFVQWNRGVRLSQGKYVWIAEADDLCTPDFLERLVRVMDYNPSVGLVYCNTTPIDGAGAVIDSGFYHHYVSDLDPTRWLDDFTANGLNEVRQYLARKNIITNVSGVLFRRDVFVRAGYAPEHMRMCGDWMTYCHILHEADVAYINAPLNFHRQHPTKHTQNSVLDLTYFHEFLQVQAYLAEAFDLSNEEKKAAFHRFLGEWDRLTVSNYGRIGLAGTLTLAHMTTKSYPEPARFFEISAHFLLNSAKSLAGKLLIK